MRRIDILLCLAALWTAHAQIRLFAPVSVLSSPDAASGGLRPL